LIEACTLRVFENRVLRRLFGLERDEVTEEWRKRHNDNINDLYSLPNVVRLIKSRMRWARHVACIRRREAYTGYWWGSLMVRDHLEDPGVDRRIILRWILRK